MNAHIFWQMFAHQVDDFGNELSLLAHSATTSQRLYFMSPRYWFYEYLAGPLINMRGWP